MNQKNNKNGFKELIELNAADLERQQLFSLPISQGFFLKYFF